MSEMYEYGTCKGGYARRDKINGSVQFIIWKAGEQGHIKDCWVNFDKTWWAGFLPEEKINIMKEEKIKFLKVIKWMGLIVFTLWLASLLHKCNNSEPSITLQKVTTKEVKGSFEAKEVKNVPISSKMEHTKKQQYVNSKQFKNDKFLQEQIDKLLAENQKQLEDFAKANDSLQKLLYEKAIQLNEFSQTFDDDKVKIDVSGIAQGTVKSIKANYTIKPQTIEVPVKQKERVFALKTGIEYGNSIELNKGVFKGNLEFENRKGNSYNAGYDTDKRIWVGYKITIFDIKR